MAYTVILGEEELKAGKAVIREMASSQQVEVPLEAIVGWLQGKIQAT